MKRTAQTLCQHHPTVVGPLGRRHVGSDVRAVTSRWPDASNQANAPCVTTDSMKDTVILYCSH